MGPNCVCRMDENPPCPTPLSHMADKAYMVVGHAAYALNTLTILQVFQTRLLKSLDEKCPGVSVCSGRPHTSHCYEGMGSLVMLQCHLWLTLTDMRDVDKSLLLDTPVMKGLFGDIVGTFSEDQKQSKMMTILAIVG